MRKVEQVPADAHGLLSPYFLAVLARAVERDHRTGLDHRIIWLRRHHQPESLIGRGHHHAYGLIAFERDLGQIRSSPIHGH